MVERPRTHPAGVIIARVRHAAMTRITVGHAAIVCVHKIIASDRSRWTGVRMTIQTRTRLRLPCRRKTRVVLGPRPDRATTRVADDAILRDQYRGGCRPARSRVLPSHGFVSHLGTGRCATTSLGANKARRLTAGMTIQTKRRLRDPRRCQRGMEDPSRIRAGAGICVAITASRKEGARNLGGGVEHLLRQLKTRGRDRGNGRSRKGRSLHADSHDGVAN